MESPSPTRPSVLMVGAFPRPAALERFVSGDLAERLSARGWNVEITSRQAGRLARFAAIVFETWRARNRCAIACVDVFSGSAFLWAEAACAVLRHSRTPYVLTLHGGDLPGFAERQPSRVGQLLASAAAVTCPSPYLANTMKAIRGDLTLLPNGLSLERYSFREPCPAPRRLVWLRAFHAIYNPVMAVEVLAELRRDQEMTLTMIGPDKGDGSLQNTLQRAARLGVSSAVNFLGAIPKTAVPPALAAADIFLNTSNFDNTPVSVIEAMASGLPVVSTDVGGISSLLQDGRTGMLVPPSDEGAMARAVRRLVREPELARGLSVSARRAVAGFDWKVVLPQWESLLGEVLSGRPGSAAAPSASPLKSSPRFATKMPALRVERRTDERRA